MFINLLVISKKKQNKNKNKKNNNNNKKQKQKQKTEIVHPNLMKVVLGIVSTIAVFTTTAYSRIPDLSEWLHLEIHQISGSWYKAVGSDLTFLIHHQ